MSKPMVVPNRNGDAPSSEELTQVQAAARAKGLFSDWPYVMVPEEGDLLLCCEPQTGEHGADLIARKNESGWAFYMDSDMTCKEPL